MKNMNLKTFIHLAVGVVIVMWSALIAMKVGNDFSGSVLITIVTFVVSCVFLCLVYFAIQAIVMFIGTFIPPKEKHLHNDAENKVLTQEISEEIQVSSDENNIESTTDLENHETKYDDTKNWLTLRAEYYFKTAIKDKYIKKLGEDNYKWGLSARSFICFLMRAYDPLSPPYDRIGKMFGLTNLTQNRDGLLKSDWYTDEERRIQGNPPKQGKTYKKPPPWYIEIDEYCDELDRNYENDE